MNRKTRSQPNTQISEEAAEWFVDFRSGDVDPEGRRAFEAWVRSSPEHLRAYLEYAAIWNEGDAVDRQGEIDVAVLIAAAQAERNVIRLESTGREKQDWSWVAPRPHRRIAVAAALLLVVTGAVTLAYFQLFHVPTYSTEAGEQRSIRLSDGSTVELNSRSRLRVRFDDANERLVELLEGQALFRVAKDPARPFIVQSDATQVRAVGTQFDVNRKRASTIVTVIEGKVAISGDLRKIHRASAVDTIDAKPRPRGAVPIYLSAGEQLAVNTETIPTPTRADVAATTAWTQRKLVLESAPLSEVAEEFNRYSARKLKVRDAAAEELRLSGVFETDPDFLLRYLRARPDITVVETDTDIEIIRHQQN